MGSNFERCSETLYIAVEEIIREHITTSCLILNACIYKSIIKQLLTSIIMVQFALNYGSPKTIFFGKKHYDKKKYV